MTDPLVKLMGEWSAGFGAAAIALRLAAALFLSAVIGFERAAKRHAAGLRTFILVCLTSCAAMMLDMRLGSRYFLISAAALFSVAMLSMNSTVFSSRNQIKGLTTSIALWTAAAVGLAIGASLYTFALLFFAAFFFGLSMLPGAEVWLKNKSNHFEIHLELKTAAALQDFVATIRKLGMKIDDIEANPAYINSGLSVYTVAMTVSSEELKKYKSHGEIIEALSTLEYINHVEEIR